MRLKREFLLHHEGGNTVLVPTENVDFSGILRGNKALGEVLELLKTDTTEAEVISAMKTRFDAPEGAIEEDVAFVLAQLREIGALDE